MREIYQLMRVRTFDQIPAKLREMKRLWLNDPGARGVVLRREAEALLFEEGLSRSRERLPGPAPPHIETDGLQRGAHARSS